MNKHVIIATGLAVATIGGVLLANNLVAASTDSIIRQLIAEGKLSANYTFTNSDIDMLLSLGYDIDSSVFKKARSIAYEKAALEASVSGGYVSWSPYLGYYVEY